MKAQAETKNDDVEPKGSDDPTPTEAPPKPQLIVLVAGAEAAACTVDGGCC